MALALDQAAKAARALVNLPLVRHQLRRTPRNPFTLRGYDTIQGFLPREECERLRQLADESVRGGSRVLGDAYVVERARNSRNTDTQVTQLMNAQALDAGLAAFMKSGRIQALFQERLGIPMTMESVTIQIDEPDTQTKRGFHIDSLVRPNYKAFIYLNDVLRLEDGPYTLVPTSHLHVSRKAANILYNLATSRPLTDMSLFYRDVESHQFLAKAGDLIVSCQSCAHKGWSGHSGQRRYVLICYLKPQSEVTGDFKLGKDLVPQDESSRTAS